MQRIKDDDLPFMTSCDRQFYISKTKGLFMLALFTRLYKDKYENKIILITNVKKEVFNGIY